MHLTLFEIVITVTEQAELNLFEYTRVYNDSFWLANVSKSFQYCTDTVDSTDRTKMKNISCKCIDFTPSPYIPT